MITIKEEAKKLIDNLPDEITWDDLMYEIYVRQKVELGLKAVDKRRVISHDEMKKRFSPK
jgi:hypothetical protein